MSISFQHTLDIPAAPAAVFAIVDDPTRTPEWLTRCLSLEKLTPGPTAVGTRLRYAYSDAGRDAVMDGEVTAREQDARLAMRFADATMVVTVDFRLAPGSGGGTSLTHRVEVQPQSVITRVFAPLIRRRLAGQTIHAMEALRALAHPHG